MHLSSRWGGVIERRTMCEVCSVGNVMIPEERARVKDGEGRK